MRVTRWVPTTNLMVLRRMGKLGEELGETAVALAECIEDGLHVANSVEGRDREALAKEIADVLTQCKLTIEALGLQVELAVVDAAAMQRPTLVPWLRQSEQASVRKLLGSVGLTMSVASRCVIQGIDKTDPATQKTNKLRLEEAITALVLDCMVAVHRLELSVCSIVFRALVKEQDMRTWEAMFTDGSVTGRLPERAGFYWFTPGKSGGAKTGGVVEKRDGEGFVRFTDGGHLSWAVEGDRYEGPLEPPA